MRAVCEETRLSKSAQAAAPAVTSNVSRSMTGQPTKHKSSIPATHSVPNTSAKHGGEAAVSDVQKASTDKATPAVDGVNSKITAVAPSEIAVRFLNEGAMPLLVQMLDEGLGSARMQAAAAISNMCKASPDCRFVSLKSFAVLSSMYSAVCVSMWMQLFEGLFRGVVCLSSYIFRCTSMCTRTYRS